MLKLIITDLDGTLLDSKKNISVKTAEKLKELNARGIALALISGRHRSEMERYVKQLAMYSLDINFIVSCDGVYTENVKKGLVEPPSFLGVGSVKEILRACHNWGKYTIVTEAQTYQISAHPLWLHRLKRFVCHEKSRVIFVKEHEIYKVLEGKNIEKIVLNVKNDDSRIILKKLLLQFKNEVSCHTNGTSAVEILSKHASKLQAAKKILDYSNIKNKETIYFGDEGNDLECIKYFDCSYAMGNAAQYIKDAARNVVEDNDNEGVLCELARLEEKNYEL